MNQPSFSSIEADRKKSGRLNKDAAYHIAKAMHHSAACEFYLLQTINEAQATGTAKAFLKELANRAAFIRNRVLGKLTSSESKAELKKEMEDPLYLDQITDAFIALTPENRAKAEAFLSATLQTQQKKEEEPCS